MTKWDVSLAFLAITERAEIVLESNHRCPTSFGYKGNHTDNTFGGEAFLPSLQSKPFAIRSSVAIATCGVPELTA
jgi:hypothetical protein